MEADCFPLAVSDRAESQLGLEPLVELVVRDILGGEELGGEG